MKTCTYCGETFENGRVYSNHVRWKHLKIKFSEEGLKRVRENAYSTHQKYSENSQAAKGEKIVEERNCACCGKLFVFVTYRNINDTREGFCSNSCAHSRNSTEHQIARSEGLVKCWKENDEFVRKQLEKNQRNKIFSSKVERQIVKHFKEKFPEDSWIAGGAIKLAPGIFTARDLYSDKLKVCVEYDGIWHFKDINGQLEIKQMKDRLLAKWCEENSYRLIRISEERWHSQENVLELLESAVYKQFENFITLY